MTRPTGSGAISSDDPGLGHALHLWQRVLGEENRWSEEWGAVAMAALEYVALSLGDLMDSLTVCTQPAADVIGEAGSVSQSYLTNFGEEIVRGHFLFVVSAMINRVQGPIKVRDRASSPLSPLSLSPPSLSCLAGTHILG